MKTRYEDIIDVTKIGRRAVTDMNPICAMASQDRTTAAAKDATRRLVLAIDVQNDFIEASNMNPDGSINADAANDPFKGGSLLVPGSAADVDRSARFIYENLGGITKIMCSSDTHSIFQIFHPCWWKSPDTGKNPDPYTVITYDDYKNNVWRPVYGDIRKSEKYLMELEKGGKKQLTIWPYHCINGTDGHSLENEFAKMVYFHSVARLSKPIIVPKGQDSYSEMYGIIKAEYSENGFINTTVLKAFEDYNEIYVIGQAASHCVLESVLQIAEHYETRPEITQKITILEDCTSPIPGTEAITQATFDTFKNKYGIKFAKSTDIQLVV